MEKLSLSALPLFRGLTDAEADAAVVGEDAASEALTHAQNDGRAEEAADGCTAGECAGDDGG